MNHIENFLRTLRGRFFATILTCTEPDMVKVSEAGDRNPFLGRVVKLSKVECELCTPGLYEQAVNDRRSAEGKPSDFLAKPRVWGRRVEDTCLIEHKGQLYLEYIARKCLSVDYQVDGRHVLTESVQPWLKPKATSSRQGLDDEVVVRCVKVENVQSVEVDFTRARRLIVEESQLNSGA